ncbi:MAG: sulfur carrier protein ThiS [Gaiellales bacterium]
MDPTEPAPAIAIVVNGEPAVVAVGATILDLARQVGLQDDERGVAIARAGVVVPRAAWPDTTLTADDAVEVVRATAGG